jgi:ubiquinone/menaquinone biosynthesis C-methylase UbiE
MLSTFLDLAGTESAIDLKQRPVLLHSPIDQLPYPEATFDYIYSCAVLLHNPYRDVRNILDEFNRLLKPTGKLILASSFPNVFNLDGLQNYIYSSWLTPADANGPVRAYTRHQVKKLFVDWNELHILPTGVTLLPREIAKIPLPLGQCIRRVNGWFEEKNFRVLSQSSLFIKYFDVVAQK